MLDIVQLKKNQCIKVQATVERGILPHSYQSDENTAYARLN